MIEKHFINEFGLNVLIEDKHDKETAIGFDLETISTIITDKTIVKKILSNPNVKIGLNAFYVNDSDHTFIFEITENSIELTGWYYGEPNDKFIEMYNHDLVADFYPIY